MKIVYMATAIVEDGQKIYENVYEDAEQALTQAVKMCDDIHKNTNMKVIPDAEPYDFFAKGDVVPAPPIGTDM